MSLVKSERGYYSPQLAASPVGRAAGLPRYLAACCEVLYSAHEIKLMRQSGRLAQHLLNTLGEAAAGGVTPGELDQMARRILAEAGARSPFLGKKIDDSPPFPAAITVSVNDAIVHGIPGQIPFNEGDLVSLDVGVLLHGYIGDTAGTFAIGAVSPAAARLLRVTREALDRGIAQARSGNTTGDIGWAVQDHIESHGYSVVRPLCGHGVGKSLWEDPQVPNYGRPGTGTRLRPGMTIAIEPMVNAGHHAIRRLPDKWTIATADGSLSAHFEHTVAITSDGPEILTVDA